MQCKSIRFIVSLITSIILLGHTLVPHHHTEEHQPGHSHSHQYKIRGLKDFFSQHCHSSDCFTRAEKHEIGKTVGQHAPAIATSIYYNAGPVTLHRPVQRAYKCTYTYTSPHLVNLDFRGPPHYSV